MTTINQISQAFKMGPLATLRLRAECLLNRIDNKAMRPVNISECDREKIDRIASAPREEDEEFLGSFDYIYEQDIEDKELEEAREVVRKLELRQKLRT
jgi:DNA replication protein DnaC